MRLEIGQTYVDRDKRESHAGRKLTILSVDPAEEFAVAKVIKNGERLKRDVRISKTTLHSRKYRLEVG